MCGDGGQSSRGQQHDSHHCAGQGANKGGAAMLTAGNARYNGECTTTLPPKKWLSLAGCRSLYFGPPGRHGDITNAHATRGR